MKALMNMINALFLIFLSSFPGTPARSLPEHPLDKLIQLVRSPCKLESEENSCSFFGRKTDYRRNPSRPPPSPTSAPPTKEISVMMAGYGRAASPPPPPPTSAPPTKEISFTVTGYGRAASPPPPSPTSAPPTKERSFTMAGYGRTASPPPPSPTSAPPTKEISFTMGRYGRASTPPPPPPKSSPPTHQVSSIGLSLEKSPPNPSWAST